MFTDDKEDVYLDIFSNFEEIILVDDHLKERLKVIKEEGLKLFLDDEKKFFLSSSSPFIKFSFLPSIIHYS